MRTLDILTAAAQLSQLVDEAAAGEEIIIAKAGKPVTKLAPIVSPDRRPERQLGSLAGRTSMPPEFDLPLADAVIEAFEGGAPPTPTQAPVGDISAIFAALDRYRGIPFMEEGRRQPSLPPDDHEPLA